VLQFSKADFAGFVALHPVQSGDDTAIALDASDAVTLTNVTASRLTAAQFRFVWPRRPRDLGIAPRLLSRRGPPDDRDSEIDGRSQRPLA
jgi:hypothetical protein